MVESGTIGSGQCGLSGGDYKLVHQSSGIDVASYHDYGNDNSPMPGDQYNGLQVRLNQMKALNKPLIVGEVGMKAQNNISNCMTLAHRVTLMNNKMAAQFPAGVDAFIPWDWMPSAPQQCIYETITASDPLMTLLHNYPLLNNTSSLTNTTLSNPSDTLPPTTVFTDLPLQVTIGEPDQASIVQSGQTINLTAAVSGNDSATKVSFYVNSVLICSSFGQPYACTWTVPQSGTQQYQITAIATDSSGNTAKSNMVSITGH